MRFYWSLGYKIWKAKILEKQLMLKYFSFLLFYQNLFKGIKYLLCLFNNSSMISHDHNSQNKTVLIIFECLLKDNIFYERKSFFFFVILFLILLFSYKFDFCSILGVAKIFHSCQRFNAETILTFLNVSKYFLKIIKDDMWQKSHF